MKQTKEFAPADRYLYDFGMCTSTKGWAQIDTSQDASYYGTWCNPFKRYVFSYCEGDTCLTECDNDAEFITEIRTIKQWNDNNGYKFLGIDPGFNESLMAKLRDLGLGDLLH